jgi:hypothetical protein
MPFYPTPTGNPNTTLANAGAGNWFGYNGNAFLLTNSEAATYRAHGYAGYDTQAAAMSAPNGSPLLPAWFVGAPVAMPLGTTTDTVTKAQQHYIVYEATTDAQYQQYVSNGYKGPFFSAADATGKSNSQTASAQSTETKPITPGNLFQWVAGISGFSGTNFTIRALKVIIGGTLLLVGIAHITGASNAVMDVAKKVPLPI